MEELTIQQTLREKDFREVYFRGNTGSVFTYAPTLRAILVMALLIVIIAIAYWLAQPDYAHAWMVIFTLSALIGIGWLIYFVTILFRYYKWKIARLQSIKEFCKHTNQTLQVSTRAIQVSNAQTTTIHRWEDIRSATIRPDFIFINTGHPSVWYLITAKSMQPEEFEQLKAFIQQEIKQESGHEPAPDSHREDNLQS